MNIQSYAQFNTFVVAGRIAHAEIVPNNGNEFLAVTLMTNLIDGDNGTTVTFNNSNGLLALFKQGFLPVGRMITVTGHIKTVSETYTKDGEILMLQRPKIHLVDAQIMTGGLGATPRSEDAPKRRPAVRPSQAGYAGTEVATDQAPVF